MNLLKGMNIRRVLEKKATKRCYRYSKLHCIKYSNIAYTNDQCSSQITKGLHTHSCWSQKSSHFYLFSLLLLNTDSHSLSLSILILKHCTPAQASIFAEFLFCICRNSLFHDCPPSALGRYISSPPPIGLFA